MQNYRNRPLISLSKFKIISDEYNNFLDLCLQKLSLPNLSSSDTGSYLVESILQICILGIGKKSKLTPFLKLAKGINSNDTFWFYKTCRILSSFPDILAAASSINSNTALSLDEEFSSMIKISSEFIFNTKCAEDLKETYRFNRPIKKRFHYFSSCFLSQISFSFKDEKVVLAGREQALASAIHKMSLDFEKSGNINKIFLTMDVFFNIYGHLPINNAAKGSQQSEQTHFIYTKT